MQVLVVKNQTLEIKSEDDPIISPLFRPFPKINKILLSARLSEMHKK